MSALRPLALSLILSVGLWGQSPVESLQKELKDNSHAMADLATLSDDFGPRLTGSENLRKAQAWAAQKLKEYGAVNVHEEAYDFGKSWTRGTDSARLLTQSGMRLNVAAMAWNPGTNGPIHGEVVSFSGPVDEVIARMSGFNGKIVMIGGLTPPKDPSKDGELRKAAWKGLGTSGAKALIWGSEHGDGKMTMLGSPHDYYFVKYLPPWPRLPFAFMQPEHFKMLRRMLKSGKKVEIELNLGGTFSDKPVKAYNVMGEIRGSEKPDEIVIIGAHLDSWDLGQGATDNGTGSIAILETLRAVHASGIKPKRTIRVVLFSGEEQGLCGSMAYVKDHAAELKNTQAILIHDLGPGKVKGFTVQEREDLIPYLSKAMQPMEDLGVNEMPYNLHLDSDQDPFVELGIPGFFAVQEDSDYMTSLHHSQVDTFDRVKSEEYLQSIQALAVTALGFAKMDAKLPQRKPAAN